MILNIESSSPWNMIDTHTGKVRFDLDIACPMEVSASTKNRKWKSTGNHREKSKQKTQHWLFRLTHIGQYRLAPTLGPFHCGPLWSIVVQAARSVLPFGSIVVHCGPLWSIVVQAARSASLWREKSRFQSIRHHAQYGFPWHIPADFG